MIVTVRIAPMEHWCPESRSCYARHNLNGPAIEGKEIQIDTMTMKEWNSPEADYYNPNVCTGRFWTIESSSEIIITQLTGAPPLGAGQLRVICEHMLELD